MSRLERVTHKLFAENAPVVESGTTQVEIGQFGSALAGTYVATNDVATLQALPAYTRGWGGAVISENNFPTLEDMNAVQRVQSYQTGYLFQEGIAEYDENTEYGLGSLCKIINGTNVKIYQSLINENVGRPITDNTAWQEFTIGGDLYVRKSGDTMTGNLNINKANGQIFITGGNGYKSLVAQNSEIDYTATDQVNLQGARLISNDKNAQWWAYSQHTVASQGNYYNTMGIRRVIGGVVKQGTIGISVSPNGTVFTEAPTPATNDNSTKIATTAYVRNASVGYPDYTKGVSKANNTQYTADTSGQLIVVVLFNSELQFTYNGTTIKYSPNANGQGWRCTFTYLIKKGATYKVYTASGFDTATFFPVS